MYCQDSPSQQGSRAIQYKWEKHVSTSPSIILTASATWASVISSKNCVGFSGGLGNSPAVPIIIKVCPYIHFSDLIDWIIHNTLTSFKPNLLRSVVSFSTLVISTGKSHFLPYSLPWAYHPLSWSFVVQEEHLFGNRSVSWITRDFHRCLLWVSTRSFVWNRASQLTKLQVFKLFATPFDVDVDNGHRCKRGKRKGLGS